jgi:hypothetical protein
MQNLKKLSNLIKLSSNIRILIPSTFKIDQEIDNAAQVDKALTFFSNLFGGATSFKALGAWQSPTAGLVKENVVAVESFCDSQALENSIDQVLTFCENLKQDMKQDAISLFVNNELYFI